MKISYAVCTHNEGDKFHDLLLRLLEVQNDNSEIVVVDDFSTDDTTKYLLWGEGSYRNRIKVYEHALNKDFATHKNFMNSKCTGDWILNLDADEMISKELLEYIPQLIDANPEVDVYALPRLNTVNGLTDAHKKKWGWTTTKVNGVDAVAWPDYQKRLYKNVPHIKWVRPVHETLEGWKYIALLPENPFFAIEHHKEIQRQEEQNRLYDKIIEGI
jgi:glycosyltransferase involved in cell wall biosynthesis